MACSKCDHKGIIIETIAKDAAYFDQARPCPHCCDNKAYYRYIKEKYGTKKPSKKNRKEDSGCNVLKFPKR